MLFNSSCMEGMNASSKTFQNVCSIKAFVQSYILSFHLTWNVSLSCEANVVHRLVSRVSRHSPTDRRCQCAPLSAVPLGEQRGRNGCDGVQREEGQFLSTGRQQRQMASSPTTSHLPPTPIPRSPSCLPPPILQPSPDPPSFCSWLWPPAKRSP